VRVLVVVNPRATASNTRARAELVRALSLEHDVDVVETTDRGHGVALARQGARDGVDVVIGYGGDGTANELVNGLLADGPGSTVPDVAIVPAGSTNVFVRALGLPNNPQRATEALLTALRTGARRSVSLGVADERYFCFAAGLGYDAAIVHGVEAQRARGKRSTHVLYSRIGVQAFFASDRRVPKVRVELPDGSVLPEVYFTIITNADPWTYVGRLSLHPTPNTTFDTGLGLYARRRMNPGGVALSMGRIMGKRARVGARGAFLVEDLDRLTVIADEPLPFQIDGDAADIRSKVIFRSVPDAIRVVM
jgi:diacylglycerol kinase family enzyme